MAQSKDKVEERQTELKKRAIEVAPQIYHYKWIAASIGIDEKTLQRYREADPDFDGQLNQARSDFISRNMRKAKPDFLLQTADRETFGERKKLDVSIDPVSKILEGYGLIKDGKLIEGELDDRQDDGAVPPAPEE